MTLGTFARLKCPFAHHSLGICTPRKGRLLTGGDLGLRFRSPFRADFIDVYEYLWLPLKVAHISILSHDFTFPYV